MKNVTLRYLQRQDNAAVYIASVAGGDAAEHPGSYIDKKINVLDGRTIAGHTALDAEGFKLVRHQSAVSDFYNDEQIAEVYEQELKTLVKRETGARRVEVFDHTRRSSSEAVRKEKTLREQASVIHNDYTAKSAPKRVSELLPDEAATLLKNRFSIVNVWRSINGVVKNYPLAMCDARSVLPADLVAVPRKSKDRIGEIQLATWNPDHRWVYYPDMDEDEVLVFKTFDSLEQGVARHTIHTAFDDPAADVDAPARESLESRCFVFY